jgi:chromosome segregation ATPase
MKPTQSEIQQGLLAIRVERERLGKLEQAYRVGAEVEILAQRQADLEAGIADRRDHLDDLGAQRMTAMAALETLQADIAHARDDAAQAAKAAKAALVRELAAIQDRANDALEANLAGLRQQVTDQEAALAETREAVALARATNEAAALELARIQAEHAAFLGKVGAAPA